MKLIAALEILSRHPSDEVYLGQHDSENWTSYRRALDAFERFSQTLIGIEKKIQAMNKDPHLKNRTGPAGMPYKLLVSLEWESPIVCPFKNLGDYLYIENSQVTPYIWSQGNCH